jgi:hypothetical protein
MPVLVGVFVAVVWICLMWAFWLRPVIDAARRPQSAYAALERSRATTIWLIILAGWIGGAYYLTRIRPDLIAAEQDGDRQAEAAVVVAGSGPAPSSAFRPDRPPQSSPPSEIRALFVRDIPADTVRTDTIPLASDFAPLRCSRQDVIDAVRVIDPDADASPHRITVTQPGFTMTVSIPMGDPLSEVLLRVHDGSDQDMADRVIAQLLARLGARAFDTGSPTLIFSPPAERTGVQPNWTP